MPLDSYREPHLRESLAGKRRNQTAGALLAGMGDSEEDWETAGCISCENSRVLLCYTAGLLRKHAAGKVKSIFTSVGL